MSFENNIRKVIPYTPGEQPKGEVIKLNTNECPYPPSPLVSEALRNLDPASFRKYPDPNSSELVETIADYYGLMPGQVFVGVGSDDVLSLCFLTFFAGKKPILFPNITYSFYDVWAKIYDIPYEEVPLNKDFSLNAKAFAKENGGIVIANPNAPTGIYENLSVIEELLVMNPDSILVVDEAYIDFGGESAIKLLPRYENLVVTRTMSKSRALAGLRVGYAFAGEKLIKCLNDVKFSVNSYTMNLPAIKAGAAAIRDDAYFREITQKVVTTREWTKKELSRLGWLFPDSGTNFIFARHPTKNAKEIFQKLKEENIFVRFFDKPILRDYLRITIGTPEEMEKFILTLEKL